MACEPQHFLRPKKHETATWPPFWNWKGGAIRQKDKQQVVDPSFCAPARNPTALNVHVKTWCVSPSGVQTLADTRGQYSPSVSPLVV